MTVRSLVHGMKRQIKRSPWLFAHISRLQKNLKQSEPVMRLYPRVLALVARAMPSWIGLRARLANYYARIGEREKSLEIANALLAGDGQTTNLLLSLQPIFHLQGYAAEARALSERAERLRIENTENSQFDRLNLRIFSPNVFCNIGHLSLIDTFLKAEMLGHLPKRHNVLLGPFESYSNQHYARYWGKYMTVIDAPQAVAALQPLVGNLEQHLNMFPFTDGRMLEINRFLREVTLDWAKEHPEKKALLSLSPEDEQRGDQLLRRLGVPETAWIVGLHVRSGGDSMRSLRDSDIESYRLAIEEIHKRGGWVLRMGDAGMPRMDPMPGLVDYVHSGLRADWMDVYIWAKGRFFLGTGSGPGGVPNSFGKPCVIANWGPFANRMPGMNDLFLPKQMWLEKEDRYLTLEERISDKYGFQESREALADLGVRVIDNTPIELAEIVVEMMERLENTAVYTEQHRILQNRSDELSQMAGNFPYTIARGFMDRYPGIF